MRKLIRLLLQRFGYDIVKYHPPFVRGKLDKAALQAEYRWLLEYRFASIIDIGANEGQFSDKMRMLFPEANIYAFEPLPSVFRKLNQNFSNDPHFTSFNLALGSESGTISFHENEYSPSSSFLNLTDSHMRSFEEAVKTKEVTVQIKTLDEIPGQPLTTPLLVKIDVQGFEDRVIKGGISTISKASMVICELSFVELYKGQPLFEDIFRLFQELGFAFAGSIDQLRSPQTSRILQADGIFIKS